MIKVIVRESNTHNQEAFHGYYVKASTEEEFHNAMNIMNNLNPYTDLVKEIDIDVPDDFWSAGGFESELVSAVDEHGNDRSQWAKEWF